MTTSTQFRPHGIPNPAYEGQRANIKAQCRGAYDLQKLRIQTGLRLVAAFKADLGQQPSSSEEEMTPDAQALLKDLRETYKSITEAVTTNDDIRLRRGKQFEGKDLIKTYNDYTLVGNYLRLERAEKEAFDALERCIEEHPVYPFLKKVKGCGPAMSAVIISEIDISKCRYASSLCKYAGLDVANDGRGRTKQADHLVDREYTAADGTLKTKKSITYNDFLKTKLVGVLGGCIIKAGIKRPGNTYGQIYYDYKHRIENHPAHKDKTPAHRNRMAIRYMVKMFLIDLYAYWRAAEGFEVMPPYHEAKLGLVHRGGIDN